MCSEKRATDRPRLTTSYSGNVHDTIRLYRLLESDKHLSKAFITLPQFLSNYRCQVFVKMKEDLKKLKQSISRDILPLKEMLSHQFDETNKQEWLKFVKQVRNSVIQKPDQYIEMQSLPDQEILSQIVTEIFDEFIRQYISE